MTRHDAPNQARRRFFTAAAKICAEKGYTATRMEDIALEAGRSKGALYHHFPTKKALFVELVHDIVDEFSTQIDEGMLQGASARELILSSFVALMEAFGGMDLFRVFVEIMPLAARDPELRGPLLRYYQQAIDAMAALLAHGQRSGELRPDFDCGKTAKMLAFSGDGILLIATALGDTVTAGELGRELFLRVFDGLTATR